jgi:hypothetical protein
LKEGGLGVLVKDKRLGNGGSTVSTIVLEDGCTSSGESCFFISSLLESEEVTSSMIGSTIFPNRK